MDRPSGPRLKTHQVCSTRHDSADLHSTTGIRRDKTSIQGRRSRCSIPLILPRAVLIRRSCGRLILLLTSREPRLVIAARPLSLSAVMHPSLGRGRPSKLNNFSRTRRNTMTVWKRHNLRTARKVVDEENLEIAGK